MKRRRSQKRLTSLQLCNLLESSKEAILVLNDDHEVVEVNAALCRWLKVERRDFIGRYMPEFMAPGVSQASIEEFQNFKSEGVWKGSWPLRAADGKTVRAKWRGLSGIVPGLHVFVGRDLASLAKNAKSLKSASSAGDERSGPIVH
jgi:PAS domain S-box-containing protein